MKPQQLAIIVVLIILSAMVGFFVGSKYQSSRVPTSISQNGSRFGRNGNRAGGSQVVGNILSADSRTLTVQLADGSSKIILLSGSTSIDKASPGSQSDLVVGIRVGVFGTPNSDGSITAQSVQINPMFRGQNPSPSTSPANK